MNWSLAIHGGAGLIERQSLSVEREAACTTGLHDALAAGQQILAAGGSALDAVMASVQSLELSPWFNAGHGAVLTSEGGIEFDASIMCGRTKRAGAIAGATTPKFPIAAARAVMETNRHVLMVGNGADAFIAKSHLETASIDYFRTAERMAQLEKMIHRQRYALDHDPDETDTYGTVGAVALDQHGHLAAATSTGGMVNQWPGRVGDSAIIGAGTWADERCAISATGHGELYMRGRCAGRVADLIELGPLSLEEAANQVVHQEIQSMGGLGGLIGVSHTGEIVMPFSTGGMFRGWSRADGTVGTGIW